MIIPLLSVLLMLCAVLTENPQESSETMPGLEEGKPFQETFPLQKGKKGHSGMSSSSKELYPYCFSGRQQISSSDFSTELVL